MSEQANDELAVNLGADGVSVSAKGDAATRLGHQLADALSPFTSAFGWVGDLWTIKRMSSVLRATKIAEEKLRRDGITSADVPPRILLPWMEAASMETEEHPTLTEMWAGLFVRAAKSSDAVVVSYIETLKRMGSEEAELLKFFANDTSPHYSQKFFSSMFEAWSENNVLFWDKAKPLIESNDIWGFKGWIEAAALQSMRQVIFVRDRQGNPYPSDYFVDHEHAISNMESLGLITIHERRFSVDERHVDVVWFEISKFGFDLVWAANGELTGIKAGRERKLRKAS